MITIGCCAQKRLFMKKNWRYFHGDKRRLEKIVTTLIFTGTIYCTSRVRPIALPITSAGMWVRTVTIVRVSLEDLFTVTFFRKLIHLNISINRMR